MNNKFEAQDLIHSIYMNAEHNLKNNNPTCVEDATKFAKGYIDKFRSSMTRDLLNSNNLVEIHDELIDMLIEQEYLTLVVNEYIEIYDSIKEVEAEEQLGKLLETDDSKIKYKR